MKIHFCYTNKIYLLLCSLTSSSSSGPFLLVDQELDVGDTLVDGIQEVGEDKVHRMVEVDVGVGAGVGLEDHDQLRRPR